jgi:hypothetical protein
LFIGPDRARCAENARGAKQRQRRNPRITSHRGDRRRSARDEQSCQQKAAEPEKESGGVCDERGGDERQ